MGTKSDLGSLQVVDETDLVAEHSTLMVKTAQNRSGDVMKDVDCFDCFAAPCPTDAVADTRCRQFTLDHGGSKINDAVNVHTTKGQRRAQDISRCSSSPPGASGWEARSELDCRVDARELGKVKSWWSFGGPNFRRGQGRRRSGLAGAGSWEWDWEWEPEGASRKFLMGLRSLRALPLKL